ncbi:hypothetical protein BY996DRAFT_6624696 [Phakopsora pachyrhizi]|nr:hypothetical protein BY996DRAFT_6624696 [Phakopsora pachyrhizi]
MSNQEHTALFVATSNIATALELPAPVVEELNILSTSGFCTFDYSLQEDVLVLPVALMFMGDSPMHAEITSTLHPNVSLQPCRICNLKSKNKKEKETGAYVDKFIGRNTNGILENSSKKAGKTRNRYDAKRNKHHAPATIPTPQIQPLQALNAVHDGLSEWKKINNSKGKNKATETIDFFGGLPTNPEIGRGITASFAQPMDLHGITDQGKWLSLKTFSSDECQDSLSFSPLKKSEKFSPDAEDSAGEPNHKNPQLDWQADLDSFKALDQMPQATTNVDSQPLAQVYNQLGENGLHLRSSFFRLSNSRSPSQFDHKSFPEFGCRSENSAAYFLEAEEPKHWNNLMVPKDSAERDDHKFDLSLDSKVKNKQKIPAENFKSHGSTDYNKYLVNKAADTDLKLSFHGYSQAHEFKPGAIVIDSPLTLNKKHDFQIYSNYLGEDTLSPLINAQEPPRPKHSRDRYFKRVHKRKSTEEYSSSKRVFETVEDKRSSYPADPIRKPYFDVGPTNEKNIAVKNHELFKNALMELLQPKNFPLQLNLLTVKLNSNKSSLRLGPPISPKMPKELTKRQKLAYTIKEMELQSLLDSDSDSKLETDILYLNHLLTKQYLT